MIDQKLKEGFDSIELFLEEKDIQIVRTKSIQYGINISLGKEGNFSLYHGSKGYKIVIPQKNGITENLKNEIEQFIKSGFILDSEKLTKEEIKIIQKKKFLIKVYNILKKYEGYGLATNQLQETIEILCTEDEKKYMAENNYSFESIEKIAKKYM